MSEFVIKLDWADVLRAFGADPNDPDAFQRVIDARTQDEKDGAALRRLREALPDDWQWVVYGPADGMSHIIVKVINAYAEEGDYVGHICSGHTLAEAADKCREALPTPPSTPRQGGPSSSTAHPRTVPEHEPPR